MGEELGLLDIWVASKEHWADGEQEAHLGSGS